MALSVSLLIAESAITAVVGDRNMLIKGIFRVHDLTPQRMNPDRHARIIKA